MLFAKQMFYEQESSVADFLRVFRNYATMPLRGMKERAKLLGGEAQWESGKGHGTTVTIHVPLAIKDSTRNGPKN